MGCSQKREIVEPEVPIREVDFEQMEFRADGLWYLSGDNFPFSGKAVRRHENGAISWVTELDKGIPKGRVQQFSPDGEEIWPGGVN